MAVPSIPALAKVRCPVLGVVHLPPLAGSPRFGGDDTAVRDRAMADLEALLSGGVDGVILENFGDVPFYPATVPPAVIAQMTALACLARRQLGDRPLGINVLRNDGCGAMAVAQASEAQFVRVNVLCGARVCDQGLVQGIAHDLLRLRQSLGASRVRIFADVAVKHSSPLGVELPLDQQVRDLVTRGGADAVIVTGGATGHPASQEDIAAVAASARSLATPVLLGSGATQDTMAGVMGHIDAVIVGSDLKRDGRVENPVDPRRVRRFVEAVHGA